MQISYSLRISQIFSVSHLPNICSSLTLSPTLSFLLNLIGFYANFDPLSANRIFFLYVICRVSFGHFNCDCCPPMRSGYWTIVLYTDSADSLLPFLISNWSTIWVYFASFSLSLSLAWPTFEGSLCHYNKLFIRWVYLLKFCTVRQMENSSAINYSQREVCRSFVNSLEWSQSI